MVVRVSDEPHGLPRVGVVLVVDDNPTTRMVLARALEAQGHLVVEAEHGRQALDILREKREPPFDAVLLDLLMPDMDGYEVLARIQEDESLRALPVIVVSAMDDLTSAMRCVELGAADYLPKPINPTLLKARLGSSIAERRLQDLEAKLEAITAAAAELAAGTFDPDSLADVATHGGPLQELSHALREIARSNPRRLKSHPS